ncbi:MAG: protein kinase [Acidobacteriota bacterium]|nr:protein kinase [Acidobacteriota bacterium]
MIQTGTLLQNRYRVEEQIGKGGMGEVFVATDERFQSKVAIKRTFYSDPEMSKAFEREARLLNRLRHTALPKVSDHFTEDGDQFLVMEFIEGSDLSELLRQRKVPFPLTDVLRWADQLLDALDYLHTQEPPVIHRDIKPQNIKLTPQGKVVLLDFGLAKGAPTPAQTATGTVSSVFGYSVNFAPLEQMQGLGTDPRSDIFSLAATLYYLLTGVRPPDALTRAAATVRQQPDPLRPAHLVQAQVTEAVSRILKRAMSQNAALRHASAAELRAALRQAASDVAPLDAQLNASVNVPQQALSTPGAVPPFETPVQPDISSGPEAKAPPSVAESSRDHNNTSPVKDAVPAQVDSSDPLSDSYTTFTRRESPQSGIASKRTFGIAVCILISCAAAAAYLFTRSSGPIVHDKSVNAEAQPSPPDQIIARPEPASHAVSSGSPQDSPDLSAPAQSSQSRPASEAQASKPLAATETASAQGTTEQKAKGDAAATTESPNGVASVSSAGKPVLVIQNPAPARSPADERARAVERKPEQPVYRPEYNNQPPPFPPPPPGDRRLPPPDGRRPPPPFRP